MPIPITDQLTTLYKTQLLRIIKMAKFSSSLNCSANTLYRTYQCSQPGLLELQELAVDDELHLLVAIGPELSPVLGEPGLQVLLELQPPGRELSVFPPQLKAAKEKLIHQSTGAIIGCKLLIIVGW